MCGATTTIVDPTVGANDDGAPTVGPILSAHHGGPAVMDNAAMVRGGAMVDAATVRGAAMVDERETLIGGSHQQKCGAQRDRCGDNRFDGHSGLSRRHPIPGSFCG
jgi:hypothetical protein